MNQPGELYSYHVFLFPFQWSYTGKNYVSKNFEEKTNLKDFVSFLDKTPWKQNQFVPDTVLNYNEYNYFYDFVRQAMYDVKKVPEFSREKTDEQFIAHFSYDIKMDEAVYSIRINKQGVVKTYHLLIDSILLHLYNTGVGVLSFHLNNRNADQASPDDILNINQYGRRIFPPFFGMDPGITGSPEQYDYVDFAKGLTAVKNAELADEIEVSINGIEDFSVYTDPAYFRQGALRLPAFMDGLFKQVPLAHNKMDADNGSTKITIEPLLDDRMFVICWYGNDELSAGIKPPEKDGKYDMTAPAYLDNEWLYKYIFVDGGMMTCQNSRMSSQFLKKHTNVRWLNFGTIFGVSRYSFVCLTSSLEKLKEYNSAFLLNHVQTMYYKMTELCLLQRACVLRFSDEVTAISAMKEKESKYLPGKVSSLYKQYLRFVNKIYFREITAQEQGIELYNLMQNVMSIKGHVQDLDGEISELHNYVNLVEEEKQNKNIALLTIIGALFVIPSFIASFFGMNMFNISNPKMEVNFWTLCLVTPAMLISAGIFYLILRGKSIRAGTKLKKAGIILISLLVIILTLISTICFYTFK